MRMGRNSRKIGQSLRTHEVELEIVAIIIIVAGESRRRCERCARQGGERNGPHFKQLI